MEIQSPCVVALTWTLKDSLNEVLEANKVNTYKVLDADVLVVTEKSLEGIDSVLG